MGKLKNITVGTLASAQVGLAGYVAKQEYDYRKDKEFVLMEDFNFSSKLGLRATIDEEKIIEQKDSITLFTASEKEVTEMIIPKGYILEPRIKYSKSWGCQEQPTPAPVPTTPPPQPGGNQTLDWGVKVVNALDAQGINAAETVAVCVIDTGIDKTHPDLRHIKGRNFTSSNPDDYSDRDGHGTHTAGAVAALNNNYGVVGASQAALYIGKVLGDNGSGYNDWIARGIVWCVDEGAEIISMSLGGPTPSRIIENALYYAAERGVEVFAAAGNDGSSRVGYPAGFIIPGLYSVSALDFRLQLASFSNFGKVEFACPGVNILSTVPGGYARMSGTSMATPICAGVAALYKARNRPYQTQNIGPAVYYGRGMMDAVFLLQ